MSLLVPEAHADAYLWTTVLLSHAALGVALWLLAAGWGVWRGVVAVAVAYAVWEAAQGLLHVWLIWGAALDWSGVTLGAVIAAGLWTGSRRLAVAAAVAMGVVALAGAGKRGQHGRT